MPTHKPAPSSFCALLLLLGMFPGSTAAARPGADLVLRGAAVYTVDASRSWAEAVAVRDGKILRVGTDAEIQTVTGPDTEVINLPGGMVLPGFHDAHVHPVYGGLELQQCALHGLASVEAVVARVAACAEADGQETGWLVGSGFDLSLFPEANPSKALLDEIVPDRPVYLAAEDGHSAWVNSKALEMAGIDTETEAPPQGVIERDAATGEPGGTLRESALVLVLELLPEPTATERVRGLKEALRIANSYGITSLVDATVSAGELGTFRALDRANELTARVVTSLGYLPGEDASRLNELLDSRDRNRTARINPDAVKIFVDGVLEGETAALLEPYLGRGEHRGELNVQPEALKTAVTRFDEMGLQVHMHAIGDRAVRVALDAVETARTANGAGDNRHHIAHLQLIHPDDIGRFRELEVIANFQALWAYPDAYITDINLPVVGRERLRRMYPIGSVYRSGATVVGGSDWTVSSINPMLAIQVAVTREDPEGRIDGVLNAAERVDLAAMLAAYTINGAYLMHQEHLTGSIEVGKAADLAVLDTNLFAVPADQIGEAKVVLTLFEGETVYEAP